MNYPAAELPGINKTENHCPENTFKYVIPAACLLVGRSFSRNLFSFINTE